MSMRPRSASTGCFLADREGGGGPARPEAIDPARLLLLEDGHCLKDHALAACDLAGRAPDARVVAATLHTLVELVEAGLGATLLPAMAVEAGMLVGTGVAARPLAGAAAERRIALVWRRGHSRAGDFRLLAETIRAAVVPAMTAATSPP